MCIAQTESKIYVWKQMPARGERDASHPTIRLSVGFRNFALCRSAVPLASSLSSSNPPPDPVHLYLFRICSAWLKIGFTYMLYCTFIYRTRLPFSDLCFRPAFVLQLSVLVLRLLQLCAKHFSSRCPSSASFPFNLPLVFPVLLISSHTL